MRLLLLLLLLPGFTLAQQKFTISGHIKDASNGEALIGATVFVKEINNGATANEYGFYSITLPAGEFTLQYSYIGYKAVVKTFSLNKNSPMDVELASEADQLEEVVVTGELEQANAKNLEMSTNNLSIKTILKIPAFLGESDVFRSIQLLPGVSTVGEGASGFNVRGGSVGQNLVLLDEAPVYNSSHLFGFFSVFNPDAVKDTKLYKGAIPSRYGGRLASLLDVRMKEGNSKKLEVNGGIGSVFSRLSVEAPIVKDKASFIVAGRRSYIDILARPFVDLLQDGGSLNFYDLTLKTNYNVSAKDRLYASGYFGRDVFMFDKRQGFSWGNTTGTVRWNHLFNDRLFANLTGVYSKYDYKLQFGDTDANKFSWNSSISNFIAKPDFSYFINANSELNFGGEAIYYTFNPANAYGVNNGTVIDISLQKKYNLEASLYAGGSQKLGSVLSVDYGLRFSQFVSYGPGSQYTYNDTIPGIRKTAIGRKQYGRNDKISTYNNLQPRFSFKVQMNENSSLKGSYNRMVQYLHLISNTTASNPLDVWTPSSSNIKPELGDQFTFGYFKTLPLKHQYEFSAEVYYRSTQNQIDYIDGADLLVNPRLEADLLSGVGRAYGLELYAQKKTGKITGWVSYTLGRSELKVDGINRNEWYPTRYNQTHNLKVAAFYDISKRWSVSGNFVLSSGTPTTFPTSRYTQQGILIPYNLNDSRNNVIIPAYHRLDVSFRLEGKQFRKDGKPRKNTDYWVFSVYNVYGRKNPFSIYFSQADERRLPGQPLDSQATQLSIIGTLVPSISYNFKF
jgi:CarboxypepD_reg-like domain/TonB-dependent Receptor Plug Domain